MVSNRLSALNVMIAIERLTRQLDRLADTAKHFHERIDGETGGFLIHHVGHTRARDHQNLGASACFK
jgi:hypothetical protein